MVAADPLFQMPRAGTASEAGTPSSSPQAAACHRWPAPPAYLLGSFGPRPTSHALGQITAQPWVNAILAYASF